MDNPLIDFLRGYGLSAASDSLYDEHVRGEVRRLGVREITIPAPLVDDIGRLLTSPDPVNVILTGTAGDGKTYHIRKLFLDYLGAPDDEWPGDDILVTFPLPNGRELRIIRDLSEVPAARKAAEIGRITQALLGNDTSAVYLVAANDGQLLKLWRDAADGDGPEAEQHRRVYDILSGMMLSEAEIDDVHHLRLRLFNLSRRLTGSALDDVIDAVLGHPGWDAGCSGCAVAFDDGRPCPIRLNRALLHGGVDGRSDRLFRTRLRELFEVASANDRHVPLRQVLALVVNVVLGDAGNPDVPLLTCAEARNRARDNAYHLTNPYDNTVGANLRSERRQNNSMFAVLDAFGLGQETNNAIDDLLLHGRPEAVRLAVDDPDPHYGERLFETQRNAYVRGGPEGFDKVEFQRAMEAQRRRLFFRLPMNGTKPVAPGLSPWVLTVFHHGGAYLIFRDAVAAKVDPAAIRAMARLLIRGLNRTLTGMMADDADQLWLAGTLGRTDDPTGRIVTVDPIPLAQGQTFLHIDVSHDKGRRRPRLSVATSFMGLKLPDIRRPRRATLHLSEAWLRRRLGPDAPRSSLYPMIGEREEDGSLLYLPLAGKFGDQERAAPHTIVSGATGSGKGILASSLILDICAFNAPEMVDLHLIDPKRGVDYAWVKRLPHMKRGIVDTKEETLELLRELVDEMERRYVRLRESECSNIDQYNRVARAGGPMPRVIVFFDEVANWMQDDGFKDDAEPLLNEIATKSRASGIHLTMIYQRADNQVMTMQLRTNLGNKLVLRLSDEGSSKIVLNEKGAEKLLGKGHVIAVLDGGEKVFGQVPYLDEDEVVQLAHSIEAGWRAWRPGRVEEAAE